MCVDFMSGCGDLLETNDNTDSALEIDCRKFPDPDNVDPVCYHSCKI